MAYTTLISSTELAPHLQQPGWCVIDCRFDLLQPEWGHAQYQVDHIPGAYYAHLDHDLSSPIGPGTGRHPLPDTAVLAQRLAGWGISDDTQVVVYDQGNGMYAARLWWLLRWLGHGAVAVLDGGYQSWQARGLTLDTAVPEPGHGQFTARPQAGWVVQSAEVPGLQQQGEVLLDARAAERFRGEVEPIDPVAGHIPGAYNYPLSGNLDNSGRFKPAATLREQIRAVIGDIEPRQVIHYCGSGVSACHNILAMEQAGLPGSRLYAGSWSEWIREPSRAVEKGLSPHA